MSDTITRQTIQLQTNATNRISMKYLDSLKAPINLTGYNFRMDLKRDLASSTVASLQITTTLSGGNQITTTPLTGDIVVEISKASSANLTGQYFADLRIIEPGGDEIIVAPMILNFNPTVTV